MSDHSQARQPRRVALFVCSGCEMCDATAMFLRGWANDRPNVALEIVPILGEPAETIRLGITHTPALVVDGELLAQDLSVNTLTDLLRTSLDMSGTGMQPAGRDTITHS